MFNCDLMLKNSAGVRVHCKVLSSNPGCVRVFFVEEKSENVLKGP